jgi:hypothetical protein
MRKCRTLENIDLSTINPSSIPANRKFTMPDERTSPSQKAFIALLTILLLVVCNCCEAQSAKKPTSAEEFATSVLNIYRSKDVSKLLALSPDGPPPASELSRYAVGTRRYNSLFSDKSWRWKAVQNWDGKFGDVRFQRSALVQFSGAETSGEGNFVCLEMEAGKWKFNYMSSGDVKQPGSSEFHQISVRDTDPAKLEELKSTAVMVLKAFQKEDVDAVLEMSVAAGPLELSLLSDDDSKKPQSETLFSKKQMAGVADWNGEVGAIHIREAAQVEFGRSDSEVYVITMIKMGQEWRFEDIHSPEVKDFEAMNKE